MIRSNLNLLICLLLFAVSFQFACKSSTVKPDEALTQRLDTPTFFHNIPADSPYVITGTEPVPLEIVEDTLVQVNAILDTFFTFYDQTTVEEREALQENVALHALLVLMQELRGNLSPAGLNALGLSIQPSFAFYGIGPLPVYRMSLHDPSAFEALLQRIESAAGVAVEHHTFEGISYRVYRYKETIFPLAIQGTEVIAGVMDSQSSDVFLPYMLGVKLPKQSLADKNQIKDVIKTYGLRPFMAGFIDLVGLSDIFLHHRVPGTVMDEVLQALSLGPDEDSFEQPSEACRQEIRALFSDMPRAVMGYEGFTAREIQAMIALEFNSSFASRLEQTRASIPAMRLHNTENVTASFGLGIDIQKLVGFLGELSQEVQNAPYICEDFAWFNTFVAQMQEAFLMIPPFVADLRGFSVVLKTLALGQQGINAPASVDAVAMINTVNPSGLLQTLAMFAGFIDVQAIEESGGRPVALEGLEEVEILVAPHIAKNSTSIGLSVGAGMQDEMATVMEDKSIVASPLVVFSYHYSQFAELLAETDQDNNEIAEILEAYAGFMRSFGKSTVSLDAGPNALFLRYAIELKPPTL